MQAYRIDNLLGRLAANDKVESKLYLAYIHALTSFCLPDPFLRRTGTEEALEILRSASVRAPCRLTQAAHHTLGLIADLAPSRSFYPSHKRVMQNVMWSSSLSFLSQDDRFYKITQEILERCREIDFLYPKDDVVSTRPTQSAMELVERATLRRSGQHVSGFGAEDFTTEHDVRYNPRDCTQSGRGTRAAEMACRIYNKHCTLSQYVSSGFAAHVYEVIKNRQISSSRTTPPKSKMAYDSRWLQSPKEVLPSYWCQLHYAFQYNQLWLNKFELMVWTSTMSYSAEHDERITQALLILALSPSVSATPLPNEGTYDLNKSYRVQTDLLENFASTAIRPFGECPEASLEPLCYESSQHTLNRRKWRYESQTKQAISSFSQSLVQQWPCSTPNRPLGNSVDTYINMQTAMSPVYREWTSWWENLHFKNYLEELAFKLRDLPVESVIIEPLASKPIFEQRGHSQGFVSIDDLFCHIPPVQPPVLSPMPDGFLRATALSAETSTKLTHVLDFLDSKAKLEYEHHYLRELRHSITSLRDRPRNELDERRASAHAPIFRKYLQQSERRVTSTYESLSHALQPTQKRGATADSCVPRGTESTLIDAGFLPRISPLLLLQQLRSSPWSRLSGPWKKAVLDYGLTITALQQARRLFRLQHDSIDLLRELENTGRKGWNPHDHPEWLLLECESEIMIREVQQQIAQQMIQPPDNENAVMQLNMGEGKSSVIVPIVATALGDGSKLVRVVVAKPQAKQMYQMLVSKLAGLLDRPVYQLPFSRDIRMDTSRAELIHRLTTKCMEEGGVLMVQPEHLLSFQLMELECQLNGQSHTAKKMMETRQFFETSSRDVVDESDENFSVKFELIYTLGQQQPIEHSPDR